MFEEKMKAKDLQIENRLLRARQCRCPAITACQQEIDDLRKGNSELEQWNTEQQRAVRLADTRLEGWRQEFKKLQQEKLQLKRQTERLQGELKQAEAARVT